MNRNTLPKSKEESNNQSTDLEDSKKKVESFRKWSYMGLFAECIGGYISWSMFTHLAPTLFFIPMVKMAYTGWEVFMFTWMIAGLLTYPKFREFAGNYPWLFRLLSLLGYLSQWVPDNGVRIGVVALGVQMDLFAVFGVWTTASEERKNRAITGYLVGFLCFVTIRMWFLSMDPAWLTTRGTYSAIGFGLLAVIIQLIQGTEVGTQRKEEDSPKSMHWIRPCLGIGGVYFISHSLFSEHGLISRWTELNPFPAGAFVILAVALGISLGDQDFVDTPNWAGFGLFGAFLFAFGQGQVFPFEIQFFGGLLLAVYTFSTWFHIVHNINLSGQYGKILGIGLTIYPILQLWGVYVVAFKFMDPVLGTLWGQRSVSLVFTGVIFTALGHVSFHKKKSTKSRRIKKSIIIQPEGKTAILFFIGLILLPTVLFRSARMTQPPLDPEPKFLRTLMWAIHFGYDNFGWISADAMTKVIQESGANVIGLVETDASRTFMGNRDFIEYLAEELHFYSDFGPSTAQNTWGCGLLSQFPIVRSNRVVLPSPEGELACLIDADILVNDTIVNVFVTHFGNTEDELDLKLQTETLSNFISKHSDKFSPTILIGYLTTEPFAPNHAKIIQSGLRDTTDSLDRYCLYAMYRDLDFQSFVRIDKGDVSDTEAQVSTFLLRSPNKDPKPKKACREYIRDPVGCQAEISCGWCQQLTVGTCHDANLRDTCLAVQGVWVGPKPSEKTSQDQRKQFLTEAGEQHSKAGTLVASGGALDWTIRGFHELYQLHSVYSSPMFTSHGAVWRLKLVITKRGPYADRPVGFQLEFLALENDVIAGQSQLDRKALETQFEITLRSSQASKTLTQKFTHVFTKDSRISGDINMVTIGKLSSYFFGDGLRASVKIIDTQLQDK